jgi:hypothetical protein
VVTEIRGRYSYFTGPLLRGHSFRLADRRVAKQSAAVESNRRRVRWIDAADSNGEPVDVEKTIQGAAADEAGKVGG